MAESAAPAGRAIARLNTNDMAKIPVLSRNQAVGREVVAKQIFAQGEE